MLVGVAFLNKVHRKKTAHKEQGKAAMDISLL